jgi:catechol 2,3-dioxygenase-like lactoylglutathione lyase family enzyme
MSEPVVQVTCLSHFGITVTDLERSVAFYTGVLGFKKCMENREADWTRIGVRLGDVVLELFSPHPATPDGAINPFYPIPLGRPKIALTVDDAPAAYDRIRAAGIPVLCEVITTAVSQFFFIQDPDGTPIQLQWFSDGRTRLSELFD